MKRLSFAAVLAVVIGCLAGMSVEAKTTYVTIGTGSVTGVYYPTGSAIAKIINKKSKQHDLRVTVEATAGSVFNVDAITAGELEFGVIQSDRQYQAYNGLADWEGRPQQKLRAIFSLHPEAVTIVAAAEKNIKSVTELKGKVVDIGNIGSGQRGNALDLFAALGIDVDTELTAMNMPAAESAGRLQAGLIDAFIYTVGHPNGSIREAVAGAVKVNFVAIPPTVIQLLTEKYPYYASAEIPLGFYPEVDNGERIASFGVKATFCTSIDVADEVVYAITKEIFTNLDQFKMLHPAFSSLTKESMLQGLSAPLHPGALKYYQEIGLR